MKIPYDLVVNIIIFCYVVSALTLSGIPGLSIIVHVFSFVVFFVAILYFVMSKSRIPKYIIFPLCAIFFLILAGTRSLPVSTSLIKAISVFIGAVSVAYLVKNVVGIRIVLYAFTVGLFANVIAVIIGYDAAKYVQDISVYSLNQRSSGLTGNPNILVDQTFLPIYALLIWKRHIRTIFILITLFAALYIGVNSGSKKTLIHIILIFIAYILTMNSSQNRNIVLTLSVIFFIGAIVLISTNLGYDILNIFQYFDNTILYNRMLNALDGIDQSTIDRQYLFGAAVDLFLQKPITGYGLDQFKNMNVLGLYSHNNYLELLVSGGLLLFISFYITHMRILIGIINMKSINYSRIICLFSLLIIDFTTVSYQTFINIFMLFLLLIVVENDYSVIKYRELK